jgi:hypothetical protein
VCDRNSVVSVHSLRALALDYSFQLPLHLDEYYHHVYGISFAIKMSGSDDYGSRPVYTGSYDEDDPSINVSRMS